MGDEVFGVAPGCLGPSVVVPEQLMVPKPPTLSFEEAATTPTVYVTVYAAFGDLDTFKPNTKVSRKCSSYPVFCTRTVHFGAKSWSLGDGKHWNHNLAYGSPAKLMCLTSCATQKKSSIGKQVPASPCRIL